MCGTDTDCGCQDTQESEMPFSSEKQMRFLFAVHPEIAQKFVRDQNSAPKKEARSNAIQRRISGYRSKNSS